MSLIGRPRVGIMATHPIQYYVPWYRALARSTDLQVFYCLRQTASGQGDAGFGVAFDWDVPLLGGYRHEFLLNHASRPDVSSFRGCDTPDIAGIIRRERFEAFIVHGWATRAYWQAIFACWQTGTPVLVRGDSRLGRSRPALRAIAKYPLYRWFIPRFDGYLIVGSRARDYYAHFGADPSRMFAAPHAVDNAFFAGRADRLGAERGELRRSFGVPESAVLWLFAGKLLERKRPADFVHAVARAARAGANVWGLVVGDGPLRTELQRAVREHGLPIRFAGFLNQTQIPRAYVASDALVLPSDESETWGLVVNEAMASGLPALVSDAVGCAPDLVVPGETGELFRLGDIEQLTEAIGRLSADRQHLRSMGRRAKTHVENYSITAAAAGTVRAIQTVRLAA